MFSFGNFETKPLQLLKVLSKQHGGGLSSSWQDYLHVDVRAVPGVRSKSLLAQSSDLLAKDSFKILPLSHTFQNLAPREESRDESIAWSHLFTKHGNNDDKSETI